MAGRAQQKVLPIEGEQDVGASAALDKFMPAFFAALDEMPRPTKDGYSKFHKAKYATLPNVIGTTTPVLQRHGFRMLPGFETEGTQNVLVMTLWHESGQFRQSRVLLTVPTGNNTPQAVGASIACHIRYLWLAMLAITPLDDAENGNGHSRRASHSTGDGDPQGHRDPDPANDGQGAARGVSRERFLGWEERRQIAATLSLANDLGVEVQDKLRELSPEQRADRYFQMLTQAG